MANLFGIGSQQYPQGLSPHGGQAFGTFPGQGFGAWQQPHGQQPLQQIFQSLQVVPYQLQQLQQQLAQVQQLLQIVPAQLQQLQQLVQYIPQQIQQLQQPFGQQQQPFGPSLGLGGGMPFQSMSAINPFAGQPSPVM